MAVPAPYDLSISGTVNPGAVGAVSAVDSGSADPAAVDPPAADPPAGASATPAMTATARERSGIQPRARATRQAILTAAAEHFARYGYHATSLDRVLADSGGTKGALYFHFASKQELARAVITEMVRRWGQLREDVAARGLDPLTALLTLVDEVVARLMYSPIARGGSRLLTEGLCNVPELVAHYDLGEQDALALLRAAREAGLLCESADPAAVARHVVAVVAGHRQVCDALGDREALWTRIDEAWNLLLPAVAAPGWLAEWRASGWAGRQRPGVEAFFESAT